MEHQASLPSCDARAGSLNSDGKQAVADMKHQAEEAMRR